MSATGTAELSTAELLKFRLLAEGLVISDAAQAHIDEHNGGRPMTPADYASTSGVILELDDDVWVNAPIALHNANFVSASTYELDLEDGHLVVRGAGLESPARFWLPPAYHGTRNDEGEQVNDYAFTHGDRVRISPIEGCSMTCKFCNLPYEFRYRTKRVEGIVDSVRRAVEDPVQPAYHVLISGGTPKSQDVEYVREVYRAVLTAFPELAIDIMMVPRDDLLDPVWLAEMGVNELSVNLEIYNEDLGRKLMRQKAAQGLDTYLDYLERASAILGGFRVRSMLMVGLEPMEDTLAGVRAIAERGAVPVLSPFRPDPATPLRDLVPSDAAYLEEVYLRSYEITAELGVPLGPRCIPCSHNTLTFARTGDAHQHHGHPHMI
ncbi:MAG: radical SAM protein [Acidimicrobiales bacterium]